jgi:prolyl 4-hydroxylase
LSEVDYKIAIGAWLCRRLGRNPKAHRIPSKGLDIFIVRDALGAADCGKLVQLIDQDLIPSDVLVPVADPEYRTSESCNLSPYDPVVERAEAAIQEIMGIDPIHSETIQGQRYSIGQQFKAHHDYFDPGADYWPQLERAGGQRTWTAMLFLNEPESGGETLFPDANVKVAPRRGNLLTWNNLDADGRPNPYSMHQGLPVAGGVKYIITKWYRERRWIESATPEY